MSNWLSRRRRIIGRVVNRKSLPAFTYRWDTRDPATIQRDGFQPWNGTGNITLMEHVNNAFGKGHDREGELAKYDSQWVSTGAYGMLKKIDPTFANQVFNTNLYRIDTNAALAAGGRFYDVNDHFDKAGVDRPYATQREWVKDGGIPGNAVVAYMSGRTFMDQYDMINGAPSEAQLINWHAL